ncbi:hypothetical protein C8Q73DRAFT_798263 [Cubamyces lactineus]|nr:hypothetical protein C8Q73DRAFT_798263 [Cubamyces lactineus]
MVNSLPPVEHRRVDGRALEDVRAVAASVECNPFGLEAVCSYEQSFFGRAEVIYSRDLIILEGKRGPLPKLVEQLTVRNRNEYLEGFGNKLFTDAMKQAERRVPIFFRNPMNAEAKYIVTMATPKEEPAEDKINDTSQSPLHRKKTRSRGSSPSDDQVDSALPETVENPTETGPLSMDDEGVPFRTLLPLPINDDPNESDYELPMYEPEESSSAIQDTENNDDIEAAPLSPPEWKDICSDFDATMESLGLGEPMITAPVPGTRKKLTNITREARDMLIGQDKSGQSKEQPAPTKKTEEQYLREAQRIINNAPSVETLAQPGVWSEQYMFWEDEHTAINNICAVLQLTCPMYLAYLLEEEDSNSE